MTDAHIGRLALEAGETITRRVERMREPERSQLLNLMEKRMREVTELLGGGSSQESRMREIYLVGVHDGSQMSKIAEATKRSSIITPGGQA